MDLKLLLKPKSTRIALFLLYAINDLGISPEELPGLLAFAFPKNARLSTEECQNLYREERVQRGLRYCDLTKPEDIMAHAYKNEQRFCDLVIKDDVLKCPWVMLQHKYAIMGKMKNESILEWIRSYPSRAELWKIWLRELAEAGIHYNQVIDLSIYLTCDLGSRVGTIYALLLRRHENWEGDFLREVVRSGVFAQWPRNPDTMEVAYFPAQKELNMMHEAYSEMYMLCDQQPDRVCEYPWALPDHKVAIKEGWQATREGLYGTLCKKTPSDREQMWTTHMLSICPEQLIHCILYLALDVKMSFTSIPSRLRLIWPNHPFPSIAIEGIYCAELQQQRYGVTRSIQIATPVKTFCTMKPELAMNYWWVLGKHKRAIKTHSAKNESGLEAWIHHVKACRNIWGVAEGPFSLRDASCFGCVRRKD